MNPNMSPMPQQPQRPQYQQPSNQQPTMRMPPVPQPQPVQQPQQPQYVTPVQQTSETPKKPKTGNVVMLSIGLLLFLVYAVGVFLFTGVYTATGVCSIIFALVAFVLAFLMPKFAAKGGDIQAVFFGIPMMGFAVYYFFAEVFVSVVFLLFQTLISFKIALFLQLVILVAFLVISIISFTAQRTSAANSQARTSQAANWGMQTVDVQTIVEQAKIKGGSPALMEALDHLEDTVRYSDPFGRNMPAIQEVEGRIYAKLSELRGIAECGDEPSEMAVIQQLEALYAERSRKLMLLK